MISNKIINNMKITQMNFYFGRKSKTKWKYYRSHKKFIEVLTKFTERESKDVEREKIKIHLFMI